VRSVSESAEDNQVPVNAITGSAIITSSTTTTTTTASAASTTTSGSAIYAPILNADGNVIAVCLLSNKLSSETTFTDDHEKVKGAFSFAANNTQFQTHLGLLKRNSLVLCFMPFWQLSRSLSLSCFFTRKLSIRTRTHTVWLQFSDSVC